jgi:hypothetical protein
MALCRICASSDPKRRKAVDAALISSSAPKAEIARRTGYSRFQLIRHEKHLQRALAAGAKDAGELEYGHDLLAQIRELIARTFQILERAETAGSLTAATAAIRELRGNYEFLAKLTGQLQTGSRSLTLVSNSIDVIDEATALKMARIFIERHETPALEGECTPTSSRSPDTT